MTKKHNSDEEKKTVGNAHGNHAKSETESPSQTSATTGADNKMASNGAAEAELSAEDKLKQKIAELELELAATRDKLLRAHADFDNFRKRNYKEMSDLRTYVKADTIQPVLNVFDHFKLALDASEKKPDFKVLGDGMKMILAEFQKSMNDLDIDIIQVSEGQLFDPNLHDAASKEPSDKIEDGKILRQWRQGYKMGERVLRPASVVISSGPATQEEKKKTDPV